MLKDLKRSYQKIALELRINKKHDQNYIKKTQHTNETNERVLNQIKLN